MDDRAELTRQLVEQCPVGLAEGPTRPAQAADRCAVRREGELVAVRGGIARRGEG